MQPGQLNEILRLCMNLLCVALAIGIVVAMRKYFKYQEEMNPVNKASKAYNADCDRVYALIENATPKDKDSLFEKINAIEKQYANRLPDYLVQVGITGLKAKLETKFHDKKEGVVKVINQVNAVG